MHGIIRRVRPTPSTTRIAQPAAVAWCTTLTLLVLAAVLSAGGSNVSAGDVLDAIAVGALLLGMATLGVLITRREPGNAIGWIFCGTPLLVALAVGGGEYATWAEAQNPDFPGVAIVGWFPQWTWVTGLVGFAMFTPLLFPDGKPPGPRWKLLLRIDLVAITVLGVVLAIQPGTVAGDIESPFGVKEADSGVVIAVLAATVVVLIVAGLVSAVVRYRHANPIARVQMRECVLAAGVSFAGVFVISVVAPVEILYLLDYSLVPIAIGLAMLRYRLYEVDVIIRRTLTYACLLAALSGIYLTVVTLTGILLQTVTGRSGALEVTLSTLAAVAAFHPLRGRIRRAVDRRFYRAGYDSQAAVDAFSGHLREQIDLDALSEELIGVVSRTVHPAHASIWLRETSRR